MARKLPWKDQPVIRAPKRKARSGSVDEEETAEQKTHQNPSNKASLSQDDAESDHANDENYRLTEADFVATAQLFTAEMNRQAYERLVNNQQRETSRPTALENLLDRLLPQEAMPVLPPRTAASLVKAKLSEELKSIAASEQLQAKFDDHHVLTGTEKPKVRPSAVPEKSLDSHESTVPAAKLSKASEAPSPMRMVPRLTAAAEARRKKRQQAQGAGVSAVPMF